MIGRLLYVPASGNFGGFCRKRGEIVECDVCSGTGLVLDRSQASMMDCPSCRGKGVRAVVFPDDWVEQDFLE